jgi:hypothetical protein
MTVCSAIEPVRQKIWAYETVWTELRPMHVTEGQHAFLLKPMLSVKSMLLPGKPSRCRMNHWQYIFWRWRKSSGLRAAPVANDTVQQLFMENSANAGTGILFCASQYALFNISCSCNSPVFRDPPYKGEQYLSPRWPRSMTWRSALRIPPRVQPYSCCSITAGFTEI